MVILLTVEFEMVSPQRAKYGQCDTDEKLHLGVSAVVAQDQSLLEPRAVVGVVADVVDDVGYEAIAHVGAQVGAELGKNVGAAVESIKISVLSARATSRGRTWRWGCPSPLALEISLGCAAPWRA